jgi:hypothetical protein
MSSIALMDSSQSLGLGRTFCLVHRNHGVDLVWGGFLGPNRAGAGQSLQLAKLKGVTFHIVGFDINQKDWSRQLRAMVEGVRPG